MAAYAILVGSKGGELFALCKPDDPDKIKAAFKAAYATNGVVGGKQYEELQVVSSISGRVKRKRFVAEPSSPPVKSK